MDRKKHKVRTMEELSVAIGVSRPTLSKYFHDPHSVRHSSRLKIEEALEHYDYSPNLFAMNQNRRLTRNIGIVVPYLADPFFAEIVRHIERSCIEAGYWPILFSSHGQRELENHALATLKSLKPAGVLIAPLGQLSDIDTIQAFTSDVPTVAFDSNLDVGEAFIGSDNFQSVGMIVDYLCRTGEPPCFLEMPPVNPNARKRRRAYLQAMERQGISPEIIHVEGQGWDFEKVGLVEGKRLIEQRKLPTNTVLCSNDRIAIGFIAAAYEQGLRVGRGPGCAMRVAGHDDHPWSQFTCPSLTTVRQDYSGIATRSVETLFSVIASGGKSDIRPETLLHGTLVMRNSA